MFWSERQLQDAQKMRSEGMTSRQIAEVLKTTTESVRKKLQRSRNKLTNVPKLTKVNWLTENTTNVVKTYNKPSLQSNILVFSCLHAPFNHPKAIEFLRDTYNTYRCNKVVNLGDELDFHTISRWGRGEAEAMGTLDEYKKGIEVMGELYKAFPEVDCCISNHTSRPIRMAEKQGIPSKFVLDYPHILQCPLGWRFKSYYITDGILFFHGDGYGGEYPHVQASKDNRVPTVIGHCHSVAGVHHLHNMTSSLWAMAVGCLVDQESYAFRYGANYRKKPILGCGVILNGAPQFVPA